MDAAATSPGTEQTDVKSPSTGNSRDHGPLFIAIDKATTRPRANVTSNTGHGRSPAIARVAAGTYAVGFLDIKLAGQV